jgi:hypothetical protein
MHRLIHRLTRSVPHDVDWPVRGLFDHGPTHWADIAEEESSVLVPARRSGGPGTTTRSTCAPVARCLDSVSVPACMLCAIHIVCSPVSLQLTPCDAKLKVSAVTSSPYVAVMNSFLTLNNKLFANGLSLLVIFIFCHGTTAFLRTQNVVLRSTHERYPRKYSWVVDATGIKKTIVLMPSFGIFQCLQNWTWEFLYFCATCANNNDAMLYQWTRRDFARWRVAWGPMSVSFWYFD